MVDLPLWKIWKSVGMMKFPIYGKIKFMLQTINQFNIYSIITGTATQRLLKVSVSCNTGDRQSMTPWVQSFMARNWIKWSKQIISNRDLVIYHHLPVRLLRFKDFVSNGTSPFGTQTSSVDRELFLPLFAREYKVVLSSYRKLACKTY